MSKLAKALTAAAGNAGGTLGYVEDVFSTYLYDGTSGSPGVTVNNGIDLAGEGGLVWLKCRSDTASSAVFDTERGANSNLVTDTTAAAASVQMNVFGGPGFTSTGFNLLSASGTVESSGREYASWTFRKAEKFFDVVTWTGDGAAQQTISHSLNSEIGFVVVKRTDSTGNWVTYHRSVGEGAYMRLNTTGSKITSSNSFINMGTSTFDAYDYINISGATYVAYLFAHDAGGFGDDGSESIIKCGSFTGNTTVDLGFEPAWIMIKPTSTTGDWDMHDVMRGWPSSGDAQRLRANLSEAETSTSQIYPNATGFSTLIGSATYIYIAIRRPMKTPESGTEIFAMDTAGGTAPNPPLYNAGFPVDMAIFALELSTSFDNRLHTRLLGKTSLATNSTRSEAAATEGDFDYQDGWNSDVFTNATYISWMFKRATGFFDVVAYTGTGSTHTESHNLGVAPEFMIVKQRTGSASWTCWHSGLSNGGNSYIDLNENFSQGSSTNMWGGTEPTNSVFTVGPAASRTNDSSSTYIAYLFATLDGVSKVGSYTGTGSNVDVDCGFSAGARFILIKRTDSTGDWYVWDSERGIVAGNDPYLLLNSTAAEVTSTDYIDPLSSGFTVTSSAPAALNASGGSYIFLAIS